MISVRVILATLCLTTMTLHTTYSMALTNHVCDIKLINPANGNSAVPVDAILSVYYSSEKAHQCRTLRLHELPSHDLVHTHLIIHKEWSFRLLSHYFGEIKIQPTHPLKAHTTYILSLDHHVISKFVSTADYHQQSHTQKWYKTHH